MLLINVHWHNHSAVAMFLRARLPGMKAALETEIGRRAGDSEGLPQQAEEKPNELMSRTASRRHRYQLVERLGALHTSLPDAVGLIEISGVIQPCMVLKETACSTIGLRDAQERARWQRPRATGTGQEPSVSRLSWIYRSTCDRRVDKFDYFRS